MKVTNALQKVYQMDGDFYKEIKKEFYARYRREGKSKYSKTDFDQLSCMASDSTTCTHLPLDYRFTVKSESYYIAKVSDIVERWAIRAKRIKSTIEAM